MKNETIEKYFKALNKHFVSKIMNAEYQLIKINEHHATILIDEKYKYCLWCSLQNTWENLDCYNHYENTIVLNFTTEEKKTLYKRFTDIYKDEQKNPDEVKKRYEQFLKLQKEFSTDNTIES